MISQRFDEARAEADKADERRQAGTPLGALHVVPITIKDAFEVDGMTCQVGVPDYTETVSRNDSMVVDRLKAAGAIILGKTNTPFMCADWQSFNELTGTSNNPYNLDHLSLIHISEPTRPY